MKNQFIYYLNLLIKLGADRKELFSNAWKLAKLVGKTEILFERVKEKENEWITEREVTNGTFYPYVSKSKNIVVRFTSATDHNKIRSFRLENLIKAK